MKEPARRRSNERSILCDRKKTSFKELALFNSVQFGSISLGLELGLVLGLCRIVNYVA